MDLLFFGLLDVSVILNINTIDKLYATKMTRKTCDFLFYSIYFFLGFYYLYNKYGNKYKNEINTIILVFAFLFTR
jgi:hypothetical protein